MTNHLRTFGKLLLAFALAAPSGCKNEEAPPPAPAVAKPAAPTPPPPPPPLPPPMDMALKELPFDAVAAAKRCPSEMSPIPVGNGCIDKWEASAGTGKLGGPDGKTTTLVAVSAPGKMPLIDLTLPQAERACKNAKKRLCTEEEWVAACKGTKQWHYPYGDKFEPRRCNDWEISEHGMKNSVPTGSMPNCVTPLGVYDMANNVAEWITIGKGRDRSEVRGGTYNMTIGDSECEEDDYIVLPTDHHKDLGVRCCKTP